MHQHLAWPVLIYLDPDHEYKFGNVPLSHDDLMMMTNHDENVDIMMKMMINMIRMLINMMRMLINMMRMLIKMMRMLTNMVARQPGNAPGPC